MALFTARAVLRTDKENSKGKCPVSICVTVNRRRSFHSTRISVSATAWDATKGRVKPTAENASAHNTRIGNELARIERELLAAHEKGDLTHGTAKAAARPKVDFYQYAEAIFQRMEDRKQNVTAKRYRNNMPSIRGYAGDDLNLLDINKAWLKGFEEYCRKEYKNPRRKDIKSIADNTIWSRFKMLRKILLHAVENEVIPSCPLGANRGGYPMPSWEKVPKDYLTLSEVESLFAMLGSPGLTEHEDKVLSFFLIECTAGIRHSDWSRFKVEHLMNGDALKVRTKKTGEPVYVPIGAGTMLQRTLSHIEAKGHVYTDTETASANKTLKVLAKVAGISKPITTHSGRHTCCTLLLEKGFSRESVAEVIGVSMKVIDVYAKTTRQKIRNEWDKLGGL
jgi:integrase